MNLKLALALLLAAVLVVFTAQNTEVVEVRFLVFRTEMSRAILLFSVFAGGVLAGWMVSGLTRRSKH